MLDRDQRRIWRERWLASLTEISALEYQRRTWGQTSNPHDGYVEYAECYFTDLLRGGSYETPIAEGFLSFEEAFVVAEFHLKFDQYKPVDPYAFGQIIADPAWIEVTEAARRARQALLKLVTDSEERNILLHAEPAPA